MLLSEHVHFRHQRIAQILEQTPVNLQRSVFVVTATLLPLLALLALLPVDLALALAFWAIVLDDQMHLQALGVTLVPNTHRSTSVFALTIVGKG